MYRFVLFLRRITFVLLFVLIEALALNRYANSSSLNQAKMINVSNHLVGDIYATMQGARHFLSLGKENRRLAAEIAALREELQSFTFYTDTVVNRTEYEILPHYQYFSARVVNNSVSRAENFMTIDKGIRDGIRSDMAVISDGAIAGYILHCSERFSVAISVLNTNFRTSGKLKGTDYSGSVYWDGLRYDEVVVSEISRHSPLAVGDTIVTTDHSSYFPPGMKIGTVKNFELVNGTYYDARITLFLDMTTLNNVILVNYDDLDEKIHLEAETRDNYRH